jgi:hypothetical protein
MTTTEREPDRDPIAALQRIRVDAFAQLEAARVTEDPREIKKRQALVADVESIRFGILEANVRYNPAKKACTGDGEAFCACPTTLEREQLALTLAWAVTGQEWDEVPEATYTAVERLIARGVRLIAPPEFTAAPTEGLHA